MMFKRPHPSRADTPSRHLFVGNCGPKLGLTEEDITSIFLPFSLDGDLQVHIPSEVASHSYVTYSTAAEAAAAVQALSGKPCEAAKGRVLMVKYAEVEEPKQPQQHPPVALTADQANIPGLQLYPDFITEQQEAALLQHIDQQQWVHLSKRRVQHYGYKFEYSQRGVDPQQQLGPLPEWVQPLAHRLQALPDVLPLNQLTVNEYTPGVGLSAHIDTHSAFSGAILSLSLAGGCIMEFKKPYSFNTYNNTADGSSSQNSSHIQSEQSNATGDDAAADASEAAAAAAGMQQVLLYLPPRALVVMGGECRYAWQHYIPHRKADWVNGQLRPRAGRRVSLTFRQVRGCPCDCRYPEYCDSQLAVLPPTRLAQLQQEQQPQQSANADELPSSNPQQHTQPQQSSSSSSILPATQAAAAATSSTAADAAAEAMEKLHVHQVYDAIALHFSSTRFAVWPKVRAFLETLPRNAVVADVGCGNGKYFGVRRDLAVLGSDRSEGLANVAMRRLLGGNTAAATGQAPIASPGADVLVCDGLHLPYRSCSCDAVLCIAVLHHMGSRGRRLKLLNELASILVPGGHGIVTVWATEQEDPAKTINKWTKLTDAPGKLEQQQQQQQQGQQQQGPDYMVPWHVPFHKAGALLQQKQQCKEVSAAAADADSSHMCGESSGTSAVTIAATVSGPASTDMRVDESKGAVVLQRYYHLFEQGELEGLVADVPGLAVVDAFYDRSNWCVVFTKQQ